MTEELLKKITDQKNGVPREQSALTAKEHLQFQEDKAFLEFRIARLKNQYGNNTEELKSCETELRKNYGFLVWYIREETTTV